METINFFLILLLHLFCRQVTMRRRRRAGLTTDPTPTRTSSARWRWRTTRASSSRRSSRWTSCPPRCDVAGHQAGRRRAGSTTRPRRPLTASSGTRSARRGRPVPRPSDAHAAAAGATATRSSSGRRAAATECRPARRSTRPPLAWALDRGSSLVRGLRGPSGTSNGCRVTRRRRSWCRAPTSSIRTASTTGKTGLHTCRTKWSRTIGKCRCLRRPLRRLPGRPTVLCPVMNFNMARILITMLNTWPSSSRVFNVLVTNKARWVMVKAGINKAMNWVYRSHRWLRLQTGMPIILHLLFRTGELNDNHK